MTTFHPLQTPQFTPSPPAETSPENGHYTQQEEGQHNISSQNSFDIPPQRRALTLDDFYLCDDLGSGSSARVISCKLKVQLANGSIGLTTTNYSLKIIYRNDITKYYIFNEVAIHSAIQAAQRLQPPNILPLYGYFSDLNRVYLCTEMLPYGSLQDIIKFYYKNSFFYGDSDLLQLDTSTTTPLPELNPQQISLPPELSSLKSPHSALQEEFHVSQLATSYKQQLHITPLQPTTPTDSRKLPPTPKQPSIVFNTPSQNRTHFQHHQSPHKLHLAYQIPVSKLPSEISPQQHGTTKIPHHLIAYYITSIACGLLYLNTLGIAHRDLKPENLLFGSTFTNSFPTLHPLHYLHLPLAPQSHHHHHHQHQRSQPNHLTAPSTSHRPQQQPSQSQQLKQTQQQLYPLLKIADYGTAGVVAESNNDPKNPYENHNKQKRRTSFVGTIEYHSPEVIQGKPHGFEVDYWALGCILYQLLCGQSPFPFPFPTQTKGYGHLYQQNQRNFYSTPSNNNTPYPLQSPSHAYPPSLSQHHPNKLTSQHHRNRSQVPPSHHSSRNGFQSIPFPRNSNAISNLYAQPSLSNHPPLSRDISLNDSDKDSTGPHFDNQSSVLPTAQTVGSDMIPTPQFQHKKNHPATTYQLPSVTSSTLELEPPSDQICNEWIDSTPSRPRGTAIDFSTSRTLTSHRPNIDHHNNNNLQNTPHLKKTHVQHLPSQSTHFTPSNSTLGQSLQISNHTFSPSPFQPMQITSHHPSSSPSNANTHTTLQNPENDLCAEQYRLIAECIYTIPDDVDQDGKDLINKLLIHDYTKRLTPIQVLKHPYMKRYMDKQSQTLLVYVLTQLLPSLQSNPSPINSAASIATKTSPNSPSHTNNGPG